MTSFNIQESANNEIAPGRTIKVVKVRSDIAMCWIIVAMNLLILNASLLKDAVRIKVSPMRDDRSTKR